jgi:hypothetical protein
MSEGLVIGITGHQKRRGIDWPWVASTLRAEIQALGAVDRALSSMAAGADQVFATVALDLGIPVTAVLPTERYERFLRGRDLARYQALIPRCDVRTMEGASRPNDAFMAAGRYIVDHCNVLFAVWDGEPAGAMGGTGDAVAYAREAGRRVIHLDPLARSVSGSAIAAI